MGNPSLAVAAPARHQGCRLLIFRHACLPWALKPLCNARLTTSSTTPALPFVRNRFLHWVCAGVALAILVSAYRPEEVDDWAMENSLVIVFVAVLAATYKRLPLSDTSYLCIFVFLALHEWGAHYKYSDVPLGEWMKPWFGTMRNHYDRAAHFSYGLLCGYPLQELVMRTGIRNRWRYVVPVALTLSFSALYEMLEAFMASILTPERGEEFVGMQGDMWDSQKDMFLAMAGAALAMVAVAAIRYRRVRAEEVEQPVPAYRATR